MKKQKKIKIIKISVILFIVCILHFLGVLGSIEGKINYFLNPLFSFFYRAGSEINLIYTQQKEKRNIGDLLQECQKETERLLAENIKLKILEEENEKLRKYLDFKKKNDFGYVLANVISRSDIITYSNFNQFLLIDKGANDGIKKDLIVVNEEGIVIGKVIDVKEHISKIALTINPDCKIAATILNEKKTSGIVEGELGLTIKMNFIPQTEDLKIGDIVITSGLEESVPRGLVIGRISQIKRESNEVWQNAILEPIVNFDNLTIVAIVKPKLSIN